MKSPSSSVASAAVAKTRRLRRGRRLFFALCAASISVALQRRYIVRNLRHHHRHRRHRDNNNAGDLSPVWFPNADSRETRDVLFALCGNASYFLGEFEVALKSVLTNAPVDSDLRVHVMADREAYVALGGGDDGVLGRKPHRGVASWRTRNRVTVTAYDVSELVPGWKKRIVALFQENGLAGFVHGIGKAHTIGTWFRLFANEVLPTSVETVLYMDTDAVVMANLEELWRSLDSPSSSASDKIFYAGETQCAGFVVLNIRKLPLAWEIVSGVNLTDAPAEFGQRPNDQIVLKVVKKREPGLVGELPDAWDLSVADLFRYRKTIVKKRPSAGMLHFNGAGKGGAYFDTHTSLKNERFRHTWGLASYHVRLPWQWARFAASSRTRDGRGYPVEIFWRDLQPPQVLR